MIAQEPIDFVREPGRMTEFENQSQAVSSRNDCSRHLQKLDQANLVAPKGRGELKENWTKT
jgi:hypothetical protein